MIGNNEAIWHLYVLLQSFNWSSELLNVALKWGPPSVIALIAAILSVHFQLKRGKIMTKSEIVWSVMIAFVLSMVVYYIATLRFDPFYANALSVGAGLFGKEAIQWVFANWHDILSGIFGKAGVKIRKRK